MTATESRKPVATKPSSQKESTMTKVATRKPAAKKPVAKAAPAPIAMDDGEEFIPTRAYGVYNGKKQLLATTSFKEARKALWREAKRMGKTDAATPREFLAGAIRGGGAWAVGKFSIQEFVIVDEVAA